jgi:uncharacterized membrane protein
MLYCIVWGIWAFIASTYSRVSGVGGGGLASLLLFSPLFSTLLLVAQFLVLTIWSLSVDKINNSQKNDSRGKAIVENS